MIVALLGLFGGGNLFGQDSEVPVVDEVVINFTGLRNISDDAVLVHVQIREGMDFDQNLVDRSIRSLYATGLFENVEARTEPIDEKKVRLVFDVRAKYRISQIFISGNKKLKGRKLSEKIESRQGGVLDERIVDKDRDAIYEYYLDKGFTNIDVDYEIDRDPVTGFGSIVFYIDEGGKRKIHSITFVGNDTIKSRKLRKKMKTKKHNFMSILSGGSKFNEVTFQEDLDKLREFYKDEGYLDIKIDESDITLDYPSKKSIAITINLNEGRQYHIGEVSVVGNKLFTSEQLKNVLRLRPGDVFSPSKLDKDQEGLTDFYGLIGYLDTYVRPERKPNIATGDIDLVYKIEEGERVYVESINIEGNTKTRSVVILRELALAPGDVFNMVRMKNSQARLENTRFFEEVNLSPESTNIPGRRNLKITVSEGRTGQFQFGAGFGSVQGGVFFAEFSQGNFDLFNWRSFFQGDGQKFRLRFSLGSRSSSFVLAFEEPWLFEKRLAFSFQLFREESEFNSSLFNERRSGFEVSFRKRLFRLWDGTISYRYEVVDIYDVNTQIAPEIILRELGKRTVSKVGFSLLRDIRNNLIYTTRGSRLLFYTEFAGLGGDTEYIKFETRYARYIPTLRFANQSVAILARMGTLYETGDRAVPFFDRFFLGGPSDLRGFEFRDVGPKDPGSEDPLGGNSYGFASVEYTFEVAEPLRLAIFYDWGFVNSRSENFNTGRANSNWGVGVRIMVLNNPMRLDLGIPITSDEFNDKGNQFNFSFGSRF